MRYARVAHGSAPVRYAKLLGETAEILDDAPWLGGAPTGERLAWTESDLRAPVVPFKILCIGRNYAAHARELGNEPPKEPLLFLKPKTALIGPGERIVLPSESERVEHEAELGVVIGKLAKNVPREQAMDHVFGLTCVCDTTARDLQKKDGQWSRAKGFDTFCPVGPWIETELAPGDLSVVCRVNGEVRQRGRTSQMMFDVPSLIAYASRAMTLEPGDLLVTGTPEGVGPIVKSDAIEIEIEGIGVLSVTVA